MRERESRISRRYGKTLHTCMIWAKFEVCILDMRELGTDTHVLYISNIVRIRQRMTTIGTAIGTTSFFKRLQLLAETRR